MFDEIAGNRRRSYLLLFVFVLLIAGIVYAFGLYFELGQYFVVPAVIFALLMSWGSYYYSDKIVLAMSSAKPVTREEEPYLWNTVEGLSIAAGLPMPRPFIIEDSAPNAFATGRDPQHAAIAVTRGLLEKLNRLELEGVVAHEMSHVQNYDIRFMTLVTVLVGTVVLLSDWMMRSLWYGGGRRRRSGGRGGNPLALIALIFVILSPIIAQLMRFALSRQREFLADASGALLTRYPEGLASALEKLSADKEPLEAANKATAHLYIINPLTEHRGKLNSLFSTHPPIEERVERLRGM
ncbi:MAG: zinc metalloprotease HtpX [Armatimonadota bacterium]|nr:MAG: zinc metalloprotease HtpX [Armatimonadota bacterium]